MSAQPNPRGWCYHLFREDGLLRIQHLQMEVDADLKELARMKKEHAAIEERLRQLKKEFGWID